MSITGVSVEDKADNKFLSLTYSNIGKLKKIYLFSRTGVWYDKISTECSPSTTDQMMINEFIKSDIVGNGDIGILKLRNKYYYLVKNDSLLNAMRICA